MHDWPAGECAWPTNGCTPPEGAKWKRMYIQDAIDRFKATPCLKCIGDREPGIAYDIFVETIK